MSKSSKVFFILLILAGAGGYYAWYLLTKPVANTGDVKTELSVSSSELFSDYEIDEVAANVKYLDKFMEVSGQVRSKSTDEMGVNLVLEAGNDFFGINCAMEKGQEEIISTFNEGDEIIVKGKCAGFNGDVVLVNGILVNK
jgi:hypothetical protein